MLNRLAHDRRGSAAVEFALIIPVAMLLYYGMVETTQALLAGRRMSVVATAVGDLTAQATQLKTAQIDDIFNISTAALKPFPVENLGIRIVSIETTADGVPQIKWQKQRGAFPSEVDLSTVENTPSIAVIRAETIYTYQTPFGQIFPNAFVFRKQMDMRPRSGAAVILLD